MTRAVASTARAADEERRGVDIARSWRASRSSPAAHKLSVVFTRRLTITRGSLHSLGGGLDGRRLAGSAATTEPGTAQSHS